jgi:hypothetical protein
MAIRRGDAQMLAVPLRQRGRIASLEENTANGSAFFVTKPPRPVFCKAALR